MYAETLGCMYADFGCMSIKQLAAKHAVVGSKVCGCRVQRMRLLGAKYAVVGCMYEDFGCMYMETLGCMYADFGCIYMERLGACMQLLGAKYAVVGCMYAETFGCKVCGCWVQVCGDVWVHVCGCWVQVS